MIVEFPYVCIERNLNFLLDVTRCGVIMCSLETIGYYPTAFYSSKRGLCAFNKIFPLPTLEASYKAILYVIGEHILANV